jgi:Nucleoside-diphosphate-sugar pyrophosphorylase involved in lipopolysaccharide biosynthesis/translation initiation factor 2B, gamma/epsilon subunits (eIF-2Bgamma/eIF-2Bepsilon)
MKSNQITEAIILAGGFGTRLQHIVNDVPKPMAPINEVPFLSFLFKKLLASGIEHIILSTGFLHEKIEDFYGNSFGSLRISYSKEDTPLRTGGAILLAMNKIKTDNVFVLNGDTMFDIDFKAFNDFHFSKQTDLSIALREVDEVSRYGSVIIDNQNKIINFTEKNQSTGKGLINGGIYAINRELFSKINLEGKFSFEKEVMESFYGKINFYGLAFNSYFIDIGVPEDYSRAQLEFSNLNF